MSLKHGPVVCQLCILIQSFGWGICLLGPLAAADDVVAIPGEPFGVGFVHVDWGIEANSEIAVSSPDQRIFYPAQVPLGTVIREPIALPPAARDLAFGRGRLLERVGQIFKATATAEAYQPTTGHDLWFLFQGNRPFTLELAGPTRKRITVTPSDDPDGGLRSMQLRWWDAYQRQAETRIDERQILPILDAYLLSTLGTRLDLPPARVLSEMRAEPFPPALDVLSNSNAVQRVTLAEILNPGAVQYQRDRDLPDSESQQFEPLMDQGAKPPEGIEPIASFVPPECYYARFGQFANLMWLQRLSQSYGGDVRNMVMPAIVDRQSFVRIETLLDLKYSRLADLLGDQLVEDIAVIGTDLRFDDMPSIGIVLRAKNAFLLSTILNTERRACVVRESDCSLENIRIEGVDVSLLSTRDHRIRSFMVPNGNWFLFTNCRHLAKRWIESRKSRQTLAASSEFQAFREAYPVDASQDRTITVYLPSRFLAAADEASFQVAAQRGIRHRLMTSIANASQRVASNEGIADRDLKSLVDQGLLPKSFLEMSEPSPVSLPVADIKVSKISHSESLMLERYQIDRQRGYRTTKPIFLQLVIEPRKDDADEQQIQFQIDLATDFLGKHEWLIHEIGTPVDLSAKPADDDLISFHANVVSKRWKNSMPPHFLFGGVKDCEPIAFERLNSTIDRMFAISTVRGYLAAWPEPGLIDRLPLGLGRGTPVGPRTTRLVGGIYRYQSDRVSLLTFHPDLLKTTIPEIAIRDQQPLASARLKIRNLQGTDLGSWTNQALVHLATQHSEVGASMLNMVASQFRIPPSEIPVRTSEFWAGRFQCPLGGQYVTDRNGHWRSTAIDSDEPIMMPPMRWFRGVEIALDVGEQRFVVTGSLKIGSPAIATAVRPRRTAL